MITDLLHMSIYIEDNLFRVNVPLSPSNCLDFN